jgi:hypothetical protein
MITVAEMIKHLQKMPPNSYMALEVDLGEYFELNLAKPRKAFVLPENDSHIKASKDDIDEGYVPIEVVVIAAHDN